MVYFIFLYVFIIIFMFFKKKNIIYIEGILILYDLYICIIFDLVRFLCKIYDISMCFMCFNEWNCLLL